MFARSLFATLSVVLLASGLFAAAPAPADADEVFLSKHGLPTDSARLIGRGGATARRAPLLEWGWDSHWSDSV
jgi:hypothetical protein